MSLSKQGQGCTLQCLSPKVKAIWLQGHCHLINIYNPIILVLLKNTSVEDQASGFYILWSTLHWINSCIVTLKYSMLYFIMWHSHWTFHMAPFKRYQTECHLTGPNEVMQIQNLTKGPSFWGDEFLIWQSRVIKGKWAICGNTFGSPIFKSYQDFY